MARGKVVVLEERVPKLKKQRRQKINRQLIGYVSLFFLLIIAVLYFQSSFSNVSSIEVQSKGVVDKKFILQKSELQTTTNFWKISTSQVEERIKQIPEIKTVTVEKKFPQKVVIHVTEYRHVAYIFNKKDFLPVLETGRVLAEGTQIVPIDAPVLIWEATEENDESMQDMAAQLSLVSPAILNSISEIHHTPTKLYPFHITLFMTNGLEVTAIIDNFAEKIKYYPSILKKLDKKVKEGILHLEVSARFEPYNQSKAEDSKDAKNNSSSQ